MIFEKNVFSPITLRTGIFYAFFTTVCLTRIHTMLNAYRKMAHVRRNFDVYHTYYEPSFVAEKRILTNSSYRIRVWTSNYGTYSFICTLITKIAENKQPARIRRPLTFVIYSSRFQRRNRRYRAANNDFDRFDRRRRTGNVLPNFSDIITDHTREFRRPRFFSLYWLV